MSSTPECIHGFEAGFCDSCYPAKPVERPRTARSTVASRRPAGVPAPAIGSLSPAKQRVYHVTHIDNLPAIIDEGAIIAGAELAVDTASALSKELRGSAEVAPGEPVSGYVSFLLAPDAARWIELRDGAADPAWSDAARAASPTDFVFLVTTLAALGPDAALTDAQAAGSLTRFAVGDQLGRMLVRLHDDERKLEAEALAKTEVPWTSIQLIGVANDRNRDRVRELTDTRVAVYPPWYTG